MNTTTTMTTVNKLKEKAFWCIAYDHLLAQQAQGKRYNYVWYCSSGLGYGFTRQPYKAPAMTPPDAKPVLLRKCSGGTITLGSVYMSADKRKVIAVGFSNINNNHVVNVRELGGTSIKQVSPETLKPVWRMP